MAIQTQDTSTATKPVLTSQDAQAVVQAAMTKAAEQGTPMCIAVVDDGGALKAFARMDGANLGSVQWAIDKAITAASFLYPTHMLAQGMESSATVMGSFLKQPHTTLAPAGYPLMCGETVVGGVGSGGGTTEQDQAVAEAGASALPVR